MRILAFLAASQNRCGPSASQRRASFQTRKGRFSTLNSCMIWSLDRFRFKELYMSACDVA
ncbi:hypothetical protein GFM29_13795 [Rhizobium leguminosarum bv. viciae]|nr:hypothetical protein [Rhizobium leguminosarum bv. viciae]